MTRPPTRGTAPDPRRWWALALALLGRQRRAVQEQLEPAQVPTGGD